MARASQPTMKESPVAPALAPEARERVLAVIRQWRDKPGALLPIMHAVQDALGYVPPAAIPSARPAPLLTGFERSAMLRAAG